MATAIPLVDLERVKLQCIIEDQGESIFRYILKLGTNLPNPQISLIDHLNTLPLPSKINYHKLKNNKNAFTKTEKEQINANTSWDSFDVTLLWKAIRLSCDNVADLGDPVWEEDNDSLESMVTKIKAERNIITHERHPTLPNGFDAKVEELKDLFVKALTAAQARYGISAQEFDNKKRSVEDSIKYILRSFTIEEMINKDSNKMLKVLKTLLRSSLTSRHEKILLFDPLSFLSDSKKVHVQDIFTKVILRDTILDYMHQNVYIPNHEIINFTQSLGQPQPSPKSPKLTDSIRPQILLIHGEAGSGKTTLLIYIISEWLKDECHRHIENLDEYDFVLHIMCRDSTCASLQEYLELVLPEAVSFRPHGITLLRKCNILFLLDDFDERNSLSDQLVKDILAQGEQAPGFSIVVTSRPESAMDFIQLVPANYATHEIEVEGIFHRERREFVSKYYKYHCNTGALHTDEDLNTQQVERIRELARRDIYRPPLTLVFLARQLRDHPDCSEVGTTQTKFYSDTFNWSLDRLQETIALYQQISKPITEVRWEVIKKLVVIVGKVALQGLLHDRLDLSKTELQQVTDFCVRENLPSKVVLRALFSLREFNEGGTIHHIYYTTHENVQDFYSAVYAVYRLKGALLANIWEALPDTFSKNQIEPKKLIKFFINVNALKSKPEMSPLFGFVQEEEEFSVNYGRDDGVQQTLLRGREAALTVIRGLRLLWSRGRKPLLIGALIAIFVATFAVLATVRANGGGDVKSTPPSTISPKVNTSTTPPSTISPKVNTSTTPPSAVSLKAEDIRNLTQPARNLLKAGRVFAAHQLENRTRYARMSLVNESVYLHSLQDLTPSPDAAILQMDQLVPATPPCMVFMDLEWPGTQPQRMNIQLMPDTPLGRQFILMVTGQRGPSYRNTKMWGIKHKGKPGEKVYGGQYVINDKLEDIPLLRNLSSGDYQVSHYKGDVVGDGIRNRDGTYVLNSSFFILTKDMEEDGNDRPHVFGRVVDGLKVIQDAANHSNIKEVIVVDCGVVLYL